MLEITTKLKKITIVKTALVKEEKKGIIMVCHLPLNSKRRETHPVLYCVVLICIVSIHLYSALID